jgi:hypothetical protein
MSSDPSTTVRREPATGKGDNAGNPVRQPPHGGARLDPRAIVADLEDNPSEAIAFALAHSVFELRFDGDRMLFFLAEADMIRARLLHLGFEIVRKT